MRLKARSRTGSSHDIDLPLAPAEQRHLADAGAALQLPPQHLVRILGDLAHRALGDERDIEHRRGVGIEPLHARRVRGLRQIVEDAVHAIPHFLRADRSVLLQQETR